LCCSKYTRIMAMDVLVTPLILGHKGGYETYTPRGLFISLRLRLGEGGGPPTRNVGFHQQGPPRCQFSPSGYACTLVRCVVTESFQWEGAGDAAASVHCRLSPPSRAHPHRCQLPPNCRIDKLSPPPPTHTHTDGCFSIFGKKNTWEVSSALC
jgi:hypothetical protein